MFQNFLEKLGGSNYLLRFVKGGKTPNSYLLIQGMSYSTSLSFYTHDCWKCRKRVTWISGYILEPSYAFNACAQHNAMTFTGCVMQFPNWCPFKSLALANISTQRSSNTFCILNYKHWRTTVMMDSVTLFHKVIHLCLYMSCSVILQQNRKWAQ